jgi:hypothetical protein
MPNDAKLAVVKTNIPARLDRLPWCRFHVLIIVALGVTWILDGLEVTIVGSIGPVLQNSQTLALSVQQIGAAASARHIWDRRSKDGRMGALATVVVPWLVDRMAAGTTWQAMAWWIHDNLPYSEVQFFPKLFAFNIGWHEAPRRTLYSFVAPRGFLTKPGFANHDGDHSHLYKGFPALTRS